MIGEETTDDSRQTISLTRIIIEAVQVREPRKWAAGQELQEQLCSHFEVQNQFVFHQRVTIYFHTGFHPTWSFRAIRLTRIFVGTISIMTPTPAKMDTPIVLYKKYKDTMIWKGDDQSAFKYVIRSINLCASTDIKLTISPAVDSLRALLFSRRA